MLTVGLLRKGAGRLRLHGLFILLTVALGPGVIINGILKDHWGRPRPRQLVEFGGTLPYVAPLMPGAERGKSFPCGHCSVGFLFGLGWWLWRRRRPRRATVSLVVGLVLGTLLGIERLAAGGHFLSDDLWSALIAFGVAHALYYYVLRIPAREDARGAVYPLIERSPRARRAAIAGTILLTVGILGGGLLSSPQSANLDTRVRLARYPTRPQIVEVVAPTLDVDLKLVDRPAEEIRCAGYLDGFGLPTDQIHVTWRFRRTPVAMLRYQVALQGWFTDMDGIVHLTIPCEGLRRIAVRVGHGDIAVHDARPSGTRGETPLLDLHTGFGTVRREG